MTQREPLHRQSDTHYETAVRLQNRVLELVRERDEMGSRIGDLEQENGWLRQDRKQLEQDYKTAAEERTRLREDFVNKTAREHCHCDLEPGPCSVCRARGEMVANDG